MIDMITKGSEARLVHVFCSLPSNQIIFIVRLGRDWVVGSCRHAPAAALGSRLPKCVMGIQRCRCRQLRIWPLRLILLPHRNNSPSARLTTRCSGGRPRARCRSGCRPLPTFVTMATSSKSVYSRAPAWYTSTSSSTRPWCGDSTASKDCPKPRYSPRACGTGTRAGCVSE